MSKRMFTLISLDVVVPMEYTMYICICTILVKFRIKLSKHV